VFRDIRNLSTKMEDIQDTKAGFNPGMKVLGRWEMLFFLYIWYWGKSFC